LGGGFPFGWLDIGLEEIEKRKFLSKRTRRFKETTKNKKEQVRGGRGAEQECLEVIFWQRVRVRRGFAELAPKSSRFFQ